MGLRAHTVPRFYLAGFVAPADGPRREPYLFVGSVSDGIIARRAPKNVSIHRDYYDGPGGFEHADASLEAHLSKIEWAAASAIRRLAGERVGDGIQLPAEVWRFVAWQAARTPAWMSIVEDSVDDWDPSETPNMVEAPPPGIADAKDRARTIALRHLSTGELKSATFDEYKLMFTQGWRWLPNQADRLEMIHMQAWYFQVRHFPRLHWRLLAPPPGMTFITSDRGVGWSADGEFKPSPAALRHKTAEVLAPLTANLALIGCHPEAARSVSAEEANSRIALSAVEWVAGVSEEVVRQALSNRLATRGAAV